LFPSRFAVVKTLIVGMEKERDVVLIIPFLENNPLQKLRAGKKI